MTVDIIIDPRYETKLDPSLVKKAIQITLDAGEKSNVGITIKITGDEEMQLLNQTYRDIDRTTDVLSFNQDYIDPETGGYYLGDIIISYDQALRQAEDNPHSLIEEVTRLAIHGTLHLLGHDHAEPEDEKTMWSLQENLLHEVMDTLHGGQ